jgi:tetratricopeptide (TPR) repeat protein
MNKPVLISVIFLSTLGIIPVPSISQDINALTRQAEAFEKAFKDDEALSKYLEITKVQPSNIDALCKVSELYNVLGKRQEGKEKQKEYYKKGKQFAERALKVNANNSEANFAMAISMGRMALISSGEEKIKAVRDVKTYADKCVKLDPNNFKGYHVLGKWHYEISNLSSVEKWLVKVVYGALPPSTLDDAARYYEKSRQLNPSFLLNYLELAKVYKQKGQTEKARLLLNQLQKLPVNSSDDPKIKRLGKELLGDL